MYVAHMYICVTKLCLFYLAVPGFDLLTYVHSMGKSYLLRIVK